MMIAPIVCLFCKARPARLQDPFCCDGCQYLGSQPGFVAENDLSRPEDVELTETFSKARGPLVEFTCMVDPLACEACLESLAHLPQSFPGLSDLRWNREQSVLHFSFRKDLAFPSRVFQFLHLSGMHPRWIRKDATLNQSKNQKMQILRIGITGALAGNLMLFSTPIYAGLIGTSRPYFEWIQFVLFLPVLLWSAAPFYRTALISTRLRQLSVDLPLTIAFLMGSLSSVFSLLQGQHEIYFDSLAGFLFLILVSRFMLEKSLARHLSPLTLDQFFENPLYLIERQGKQKKVRWDQVQPKDELILQPGQRSPADSELISENAEFDGAWMTGESLALLRTKGAHIPAGFRLLSSTARLSVEKKSNASNFARLLESLKQTPEKLRTSTEGRIGTALILICFVCFLFLFLFVAELGAAEILRRGVSLLIVACPCAVSFASPLARARASRKAASEGLWIRDPGVWQDLARAKRIAFDKTGTLTEGLYMISKHSPLIDAHWKKIIVSLEGISSHPVAESLQRAWGPIPHFPVTDAHELPSGGVQGKIHGIQYEIRPIFSSSQFLNLALFQDQTPVVELQLQDAVRTEAPALIKKLEAEYQIFIISGDHLQRVRSLALRLGIPAERAFGGLLPEQKMEVAQKFLPDVFVGDGTNDLPLLLSTSVSVAMGSGSLEAQAAADILILDSNLQQLHRLFILAKDVRTLIRRNFLFALLYNLTAGIAALAGLISPLIAALLMPFSSLVLLASTLWGTSLLREEK